MQVTVEKLSPVLLELNVEVDQKVVSSELDKAFQTAQRTAHIRGFRPGKAPRDIVKQVYGGRISSDVARRIVDRTLKEALAEKQIQPLSEPAIAPGEISAESAFSFKARFEVKPELEKIQWEGLPAKRPSTKVTADMIDAQLEGLRREHSSLKAPEPARAAQDKDTVTIEFSLFLDGKLLTDGGKSQSVDIELGAGSAMKELETALAGMRIGDAKDVEVTFPATHPNEKLKGKAGKFAVTIKEIRERVFPAIDDEFAKDCGAETLAALRDKVSAGIEKDLKRRAQDRVAEQLVTELCKANTVPVPSSLVEQQARMTEQELLSTARRQGQRVQPSEELRQRVRADAEVKVAAGLLMAEIARLKEVKITDEDVKKAHEELAEETGKNVAKIRAEYSGPGRREMLMGMILEDKVLDLIEAAATISDEG